MAKPKKAVLVKVTSSSIEPISVWIDNPKEVIPDIISIGGVVGCNMYLGGPIYIQVDPRYDTQEVADEIEALLAAEVSAIFFEADE